jgi:hypothetical protein
MPTPKRLLTAGTFACLFAAMPSAVHAGMSTVTLSDFGRDRLIGISTVLFFVIIVVAITLTYCWNRLVADTNLPRLTHPKAVGFAFLTGLLFFLVLVMIAGSRELLSPGAWKPKGILYELSDKSTSPKSTSARFDSETLIPLDDTPEARLAVRRESLERLRAALWKYADENDGNFPDALPPQLQTIPVSGGVKYLYYPSSTDAFLVLEPDIGEPPQLGINPRGMIVVHDL